MPHSVSLISTIAAGLGLALVFGFLAVRLRCPRWSATCWRA
jgi:CPA2 family monovalent cation:H+ antiporter-2